jgi:phosphonate transport system substrate-binding protein
MTNLVMRTILLCLFVLLGAGITQAATPEDAEIHFGSVAMDTPAVMHHRLSPLTEYLSDVLGQPVSLKLSSNMDEAINEVANANVELAYLTPVAYLRAHSNGNAQLVVKTVTQGKASFQLMIVVREDSPIRSVKDLAGKSFAFGDPAALLQRAAVVGAGIPLDKLGRQEFLGHYDNIARAVRRGFYDAGIVKDTTAFQWQGKGLRILYASPHLPPYNISASANLSPDLLEKIRRAFLQLDPNNPEHNAVIKALDNNYTGFAATSDAEYDVVRQLIHPFDAAR